LGNHQHSPALPQIIGERGKPGARRIQVHRITGLQFVDQSRKYPRQFLFAQVFSQIFSCTVI
jgi:hypothetical protein